MPLVADGNVIWRRLKQGSPVVFGRVLLDAHDYDALIQGLENAAKRF